MVFNWGPCRERLLADALELCRIECDGSVFPVATSTNRADGWARLRWRAGIMQKISEYASR